MRTAEGRDHRAFEAELKLFLRCLPHLPTVLFNRVQHQPHQPERVLIIQMAKLGDMVCTTPMFRAIKSKYPTCRVTVLGTRKNQEILAHHQHVDEYLVFENVRDTVKAVRDRHFDFGCATGPDLSQLAVLILGGVKRIAVPRVTVRPSPYKSFFYKVLRRFVTVKDHRMTGYAPREYLRLLEPIDIVSEDTTKSLRYSEQAVEMVNRYLSQQRIGPDDVLVGVAPSAGNKLKNWGAANFADVTARLLAKDGIRVFVVGGPRDADEVAQMIARLEERHQVHNTLHFSLDELKCLISRLDLLIAVDTGPVYIAEAAGVATVDIVGPVDERVQPPRGPRHKVIVPRRDRAQLFIMDAESFDRAEAERQARAATVEEVMAAAEELLDERSVSRRIPKAAIER